MPKIEVDREVFYSLSGRPGGWKSGDEFEEALTRAKAELDSDFGSEEKTLKIELNDTNRPDLWSTAGCARQLRVYYGGKIPEYPFFSGSATDARSGGIKKTAHKVKALESVKQVRPYIAGFIAKGKTITDPTLRDMIQTQEKLAWNFGRKRRSVSMGLYRISGGQGQSGGQKQPFIEWPVIYKGVNPDSVSFVPLQAENSPPSGPLTLKEILKQHPKGREYAFILEKERVHPILMDSRERVLSYPPIINSNDLGAVEVGDSEIFVELTGTDMPSLTLAASIAACDLADNGFEIEPVEVEYEYDTPFGRKIVFPYYFQQPVFCSLSRVEKFLGEKLSADECVNALSRMGVKAEAVSDREKGTNLAPSPGVRAIPPEYRNDFLHAADVVEDIMIGHSLSSFKPERPSDSTVGRLLPITLFSRQVKELFIGMGYQEMIYNYLGSRGDLVEKTRGDGKRIIRIFNPMTENFEYVRDSIIASLLASESISGRSVYPHKIFEVGKIAYLDDAENCKSVTRQFAGFLHAGGEANFNAAAGELQTLFYYLAREYEVEESSDPRFIPGRAAAVILGGKEIGVFGELHPQALENWGISVPCAAGEIDLDALLARADA